jgi:hypothetical protein
MGLRPRVRRGLKSNLEFELLWGEVAAVRLRQIQDDIPARPYEDIGPVNQTVPRSGVECERDVVGKDPFGRGHEPAEEVGDLLGSCHDRVVDG